MFRRVALIAFSAAALAAENGQIVFDFETGDLQGWRVVEGKFAKLLNDRVMFRNRRTQKFNKQGKYFLDTVELGHDKQTGVVESPVFRLNGPKITFLVGGGKHPTTYVALCTLDGKEVLNAQGINDEVFQPRTWDASGFVGQLVFVRIVDRHTTGWGHVLLDDFRAVGTVDAKATAARDEARRRARLERERAALLTKLPAELHSLCAAVDDLMQTFGDRYPVGPRVKARLTALGVRVSRARVGQLDELRGALADLRREALVANPLVTEQPILFVVRQQYRPDHHNTATMFQTGEINARSFRGGGAVKTVDFGRDGQVKTLITVPKGVARDPEVHFDGKRIVFSMRKDANDDYHIYEIGADGAECKQLTFGKGLSDIDPLYLSDGSIAFSSTREPKYCMCNRHIMCNLFRMDRDGANVHQIGKSTLFEGHGALMPDGRILYYRWEYVDRNFGDAQGLWTVNPDGTNHALYWGNNTWSPGAVVDARVIQGSGQAVCTFTSCHDRPWGAVAIIDPRKGLEGRGPVAHMWPATAIGLVQEHGKSGYGFDMFKTVTPKYEDPYPLCDPTTRAGSGKYFLCSRMTGKGEQMGIYLIDVFGNEVLLHVEDPGCYDPMPLRPRPRPARIPPRRDFHNRVGYLYVHDVYDSTHMKGVKRGAAKYLRVVESPEKRFWARPSWAGQGQEAPAMNWHDFNNKRILGAVPVEADGSAYFALPADRFVYFQLLDDRGMMIQSMRSGTMVQSGERTGCIGCHEDRLTAPPIGRTTPLAMRGPASKLRGWYGEPRLFNYMAEVQPVFNRHCVRCHDYGKEGAKKLILAGDRTNTFNTSYNELWRKKYIKVIGAGPAPIQQAYSWGSHASKLVDVIRKGHHDVKLDREAFDRIVTWVDINAPFYPRYASAYPSNLAGRSPLDNTQLGRLTQLTGVPFAKLANYAANRGPQVSFDRPELSPCLAIFKDKADPKYCEALAIIQAGQAQLAKGPRMDTPQAQLVGVDVARMHKYHAQAKIEADMRRAIADGEKRHPPTQGPSSM